MAVGSGLYMYDVGVKSSRSLSHLLTSLFLWLLPLSSFGENRLRNATVRVRTDRHTVTRSDRDKLSSPMLLCCSYGADKNHRNNEIYYSQN